MLSSSLFPPHVTPSTLTFTVSISDDGRTGEGRHHDRRNRPRPRTSLPDLVRNHFLTPSIPLQAVTAAASIG